MHEYKRKPSLIAMLSSDYQTAVWLSVPLMVWFMWVIVPFFRWRPFTYAAIAISVLCVGLWIRYWVSLNKLFDIGIETPGRITKLDMQRTRGIVTISFKLNEEDYVESLTVARSKATDALAIGQQARLLVNPANPESVLLLDLYLRAPRTTA